jgi:hypothetical protein
MAKRKPIRRRLIPSVPDSEASAGVHDEPPIPVKADRMPTGTFTGGDAASLAELRLRVEALLERREPPDAAAWEALGPRAQTLLLQLADDAAIRRRGALRDRVLATLGQLGVRSGISRLGQILLDRSERPATRALAANALGRIGDASALAHLARAATDREDVVRRQVALAFGHLAHPDAVAHLQALAADRALVVAEAARRALRQCEEQLGVRLTTSEARRPRTAPKRTRSPAPERAR